MWLHVPSNLRGQRKAGACGELTNQTDSSARMVSFWLIIDPVLRQKDRDPHPPQKGPETLLWPPHVCTQAHAYAMHGTHEGRKEKEARKEGPTFLRHAWQWRY